MTTLRHNAMEGSGFYNRHSAMQAAGIATLAPLWERACQEVIIGDEPLVIADYGSSQGKNSMTPMRAAIDAIRARTVADKPVEVIHTDLPSNDFTALFNVIGERGSYLEAGGSIFPSAIGRSYFEQIFANERVHLGWNTWAIHWLNGHDISAPDCVIPGRTQVKSVKDSLIRYQAQDWVQFLTLRSRELRRGGMLLCAFPGTSNSAGLSVIFDYWWDAIIETGRGGVLSELELTQLTVPASSRSIEQIREPFDREGHFEGLVLKHAEMVEVPDHDWPAYERDSNAEAFGRAKSNMIRAWSGPSLLSKLGDRTDKHALLDEIYDRLASRIAANPQPHKPVLANLLFGKTG